MMTPEMPDSPVNGWLRAMADGLATSRPLLCAALPRVAPEYTVVVISTTALVGVLGDAWHVHLEHGFKGVPKLKGRKCDLVVRSVDAGSAAYHFEFKTMWPGSADANIEGIRRDMQKLRELEPADRERAYVVMFAYALDQAPKDSRYRATGGLDSAIGKAIVELGHPAFRSEVLTLDDLGTRGRGQLLAWCVAPLPG